MPQTASSASSSVSDDVSSSQVTLVDVVSNRTFPVTTPICRFGRDISNDIVLTGDKSLSRFHFQITLLNSEYFVEDSGSRNGTFLNGSPVTAPRKVLNGDIISAGMTRYRFVLGLDNLAGAEAQPAESMETAAAADPAMSAAVDEAASKPAAAQVDPLTKIFKEGEALLSSSGDNMEATDLDAFFTQKGHNNGDDQSDSGFMKLDRQKETPVDELFQEQLRAINAAENQKSEPHIPEPASPNGDAPVAPPPEPPRAEAPVPAAISQPELIVEEAPTPSAPAPEPPPAEAPEPPAVAAAEPDPAPAPEPAPAAVQPPPALAVTEPAPALTTDISQWPQWCQNYVIPEIETICARMAVLESEIAERQAEHANLSASVAKGESVKGSLLAGRDQQLHDAIMSIFNGMGWETAANGDIANEVVLSADSRAAALLRVVCTEAQPKPNELASLVSSLSNYWSDHGVEPKGILLVCFTTDTVPSERPTVSPDYAAYAAKKNLCVMTSTQLLAIYRQVTYRKADVESIKSALLDTSGQLAGFDPDAE